VLFGAQSALGNGLPLLERRSARSHCVLFPLRLCVKSLFDELTAVAFA
jgi:hypothetical protein